MIGQQEVVGVVAQLQDLVASDGGAFELVDVTASGVASLPLRIEASECPECIVPGRLLANLVDSSVKAGLPDVTAIRLDDPRRAGEEASCS